MMTLVMKMKRRKMLTVMMWSECWNKRHEWIDLVTESFILGISNGFTAIGILDWLVAAVSTEWHQILGFHLGSSADNMMTISDVRCNQKREWGARILYTHHPCCITVVCLHLFSLHGSWDTSAVLFCTGLFTSKPECVGHPLLLSHYVPGILWCSLSTLSLILQEG